MPRILALTVALAALPLAGCVVEHHYDRAVAVPVDDGSVVTRTEVVRGVYYDPYPCYGYPSMGWGWSAYPYPCYPRSYCAPRPRVGVHFGYPH